MGFSGDSVVKNPPLSIGDTGDTGLTPGLGRSSGGGNGNPRHCSCWDNTMDRGATVHGVGLQSMRVTKSQTRLSN